MCRPTECALTTKALRGTIISGKEQLNKYAGVVELADTYDLGSYVARHAGSSPVARTKALKATAFGAYLFTFHYSLFTKKAFWALK